MKRSAAVIALLAVTALTACAASADEAYAECIAFMLEMGRSSTLDADAVREVAVNTCTEQQAVDPDFNKNWTDEIFVGEMYRLLR